MPHAPLPTTFSIKEEIGKGAFSRIYRAEDTLHDRDVAIKVIRKKKITKIRPQIELEMELLQKLDHPNIITCYGVYEDSTKLYIVMEYCSKGDLSELIKVSLMNESEVKKLFLNIVSALKYLHEKEIMHRDVKPKNILVADNDTLKITDFGFAKYIHHDLSQTICGSPLYMAPELLNSTPYSSNSDLWSVGIVLYEMIAGEPPYFAKNIEDLRKNINDLSQFAMFDKLDISYSCKQLLFQLLDINQSSRLSWEEFFTHEWLTDDPHTTHSQIPEESNEKSPPSTETKKEKKNKLTPSPGIVQKPFCLTDYIQPDFIAPVTHIPGTNISQNKMASFEDLIQDDETFVLVEKPNDTHPLMRHLKRFSSSIWNSFFTTNDTNHSEDE